MTLKNYTLKVKKAEHWQEIHDILCGISSSQYIPDRSVECSDEKEHSSTRGTFSLHATEMNELKDHPYVEWIELSPSDNPDNYPKPEIATKRFKKNVKVYRDLASGINIPPSSNPTSVELDRTNWGVARPSVKAPGDFFSDTTGNIDYETADFSYRLTGKNVDIIIMDSGVLQYHPEFLDANGQSRVRDIILDGPYHIDPNWFNVNGYTVTRADGRVTSSDVRAREWWTNSSSRSAQFQSVGTIPFISTNYNENNALGSSLDGTNGMSSGHGTGCAGLTSGKNFGNAFESNIWTVACIADTTSFSVESSYDAMKIWHKNKPINPETGIKDPTLINGSWGYQAGFYSSSTVSYGFRGITGTFTGNASVSDQVTAMKSGLSNQVQGAYRSWSTSSRSSSTDAAGSEMMAEGVIFVTAAGNNNQRLGIGATDPDRLNYMSDNYFGTSDPRSEFPGLGVPCNHRDWMNPQGVGFDSETDFHPVICVGAMEDSMTNGVEYKASYSNNGPGIDVWAPADETLSAGTNGVSSYEDYQRYDDNRFWDCYFNGTSAASPVATGVIALFLEANPKATSKEVKNWINDHGSVILSHVTNTGGPGPAYLDQYPNDSTTDYWTGNYCLRGSTARIIYNLYANDVKSSIEGVSIDGVSLTQS